MCAPKITVTSNSTYDLKCCCFRYFFEVYRSKFSVDLQGVIYDRFSFIKKPDSCVYTISAIAKVSTHYVLKIGVSCTSAEKIWSMLVDYSISAHDSNLTYHLMSCLWHYVHKQNSYPLELNFHFGYYITVVIAASANRSKQQLLETSEW